MAYDQAALFENIKEILDTDLGASVKYISASLRIHRHTLSKTVRLFTGQIFREWTSELRIAKAETLLRRDESGQPKKVGQIAAICGFGSVQSFNHAFQRRHGVAPSVWRSSADPTSCTKMSRTAEISTRRDPMRSPKGVATRRPTVSVNARECQQILAQEALVSGARPE